MFACLGARRRALIEEADDLAQGFAKDAYRGQYAGREEANPGGHDVLSSRMPVARSCG